MLQGRGRGILLIEPVVPDGDTTSGMHQRHQSAKAMPTVQEGMWGLYMASGAIQRAWEHAKQPKNTYRYVKKHQNMSKEVKDVKHT